MNLKRLGYGIILGLMAVPVLISAQVKIGYIQSERVRAEFEAFKEAESQLQLEFRKVQLEYQTKLRMLDSLKQDYESQRLMSSPDWRRAKETEIQKMETGIQNFQAQKVGPEGELYQRQAQMEYELLAKVKKAVDNVAISKGFDFIFDGSVSLLYGKPTYDLTDDVMYELRKTKTTK